MVKKRNRPPPVPEMIAHDDDHGEFQWKKVDVGLIAPSLAASTSHSRTSDDDDFEGDKNHYDQPSSRIYRSAERDLLANPAGGVGIFFGLEVLDGSQYSVVERDGHKRLVPKRSRSTIDDLPNKNTSKAQAESKLEPVPNCSTVDSDNITDMPKANKKRIKRSKKKKKKSDKASDDENAKEAPATECAVKSQMDKEMVTAIAAQEDKVETEDDVQLQSLQNSWMSATGGVTLQKTLYTSLLKQNFWSPTPIQAASLPAAILGRRNIVGAAPTGSGKTLAYLLSTLEHLLLQEEPVYTDRKIQALILAPTRELAMQVQSECDKLVKGRCALLVGGMAAQKQERVLRTKKPPIIIGTPGRLWEMVSAICCGCRPLIRPLLIHVMIDVSSRHTSELIMMFPVHSHVSLMDDTFLVKPGCPEYSKRAQVLLLPSSCLSRYPVVSTST